MKVLVTGANGFVGKHLVRELADRNIEVVGAALTPDPHPEIAPLLKDYWSCDLTDKEAVSTIRLEEIDAAVSLAGLANVGASFDDAETYEKVNVEVLAVLGEEIIKRKSKTRIIAVSTGAVYDARQPMPLTESSRLIEGQASPYALSKLKMEQAAKDLMAKGLDCIIARPFNHIGPGQETGFLLPDLYQKINSAKLTGKPVLVGDLSTRRDYTDVRDVAKAYADLVSAAKLTQEVYNICSGKSVSGKEILDLLSISLGGQGIRIEQDPALIRPNDPAEVYGSYERLRHDTGWEPSTPLTRTISDFVASSG